MNAPKPKKSLAGRTCRKCGKGKLEFVQIEHVEKIPNDNPITIPGLWVNRCDRCGEILFPADSVHFIETVFAEQTELLTGRELKQIRESLGVGRQDEMSEILGLGEKTFHKWESGSQVVSRSMSYYLLILAEFPEAFEWLRDRGWRHGARRTAKNINTCVG